MKSSFYIKQLVLLVLIVFLAASVCSTSIMAAPYRGYNYSYYENAVPTPNAYLYSKVMTGDDLGVGSLNAPQDIFVDEKHHLYLADTGNQRIICMDSNWKVIRVIKGFEHDGMNDTFNSPNGLFVKSDGTLYVADTENKRVVVLSQEGKYIKAFDTPVSDVLPADFKFMPMKVVVDKADRVYTVAKGIFEGIMQFNADGRFIGYMGTNKIVPNLVDYFWKVISTKAQRSQMELFTPTTFTNLDLDDKGFVYATNITANSDELIKRLNPSGDDVLKRYGYFPVKGDLSYPNFGERSGRSQFVDIKSSSDGTYSAVDLLRGRIFTYDEDGVLLYIFGTLGTQEGTLQTPVAIERIGNKFAVLDSGKGRVTLYEPTEFGKTVNEAVRLTYIGKEQDAGEQWKKVLALDANFDVGYIGLGKAMLRQKENKKAAEYFKLGMSRKYYSIAFTRYRKEVLQQHFGSIMSVLILLVFLFAGWKVYKTFRTRRAKSYEL